MDEYGKGRVSVINEIVEYLDTEIQKSKDKSDSTTNIGVKMLEGNKIKAYLNVKVKLAYKLTKTITYYGQG